MKELQKLFNERIQHFFESGHIQQKIDAAVRECFDDCIDSSFRYGDLKKQVQSVVTEKVEISMDQIDIQSYNGVLAAAINEKVSALTGDQANVLLSEFLGGLISDAPKEITMHELAENIVEYYRSTNDNLADFGEYYCLTMNLEHEDSYTFKVTEDSKQYSERKANLYLMATNDGCHRIAINHEMNIANPTCLHGIDGYLFKLYAARTKITEVDLFDVDNIDTRKVDQDY